MAERAGLPIGAATFIGREAERGTVNRLVTDGRLVTLTGSGGCGKTRLAMEVLEDLHPSFPDGIRWADLQGVAEAAKVPAALGAALDVQGLPGRAPADDLAARIATRQMLVVLDNCEHLVEACAALVAELLSACPRLHVLATSRAPLLVDAEVTFDVAPLSVPGPDARSAGRVVSADAARLFEVRARHVDPDFRIVDGNAAAVAEICRRLDGIPLAIELAAARVRVLAPEQIAAALTDRFALLTGGLRGAPARQRTLEASLDWSYGLLDDAQRLALARLSIFAGSFEPDAAEAVLGGDGIDGGQALDLVAGLVEHSLLQVVGRRSRVRYRLLETIRVYARHRLPQVDDVGRVRRRHLDHYVDLARRAHVGITGADPEPWMARLTADVDDLRAAMAWAADCGDIQALVGLTEPIDRFWFDRGAVEVYERLHLAAGRPDVDEDERVRGLVTASLGALAAGELASAHASAGTAVEAARAARALGAQALAHAIRAQAGVLTGLSSAEEVDGDVSDSIRLAEQGDDAAVMAYVLSMGGWTRLRNGTLAAACGLLERAVEVCETAGFPFHLPAAHSVLGLWPVWTGRLDQSRHHAARACAAAEQVGRPGWAAVGLAGLGAADALQGEHGEARARLSEAFDGAVRGPYRNEFVRPWLAISAWMRDDVVAARAIAAENVRVGQGRGSRWDQALGQWLLGVIAHEHGDDEAARDHLEASRALSTAPRLTFPLGRSLLALADVARECGDPARAWELAHDALETLDEYGDRVGTAEALEVIADLAAVRGEPGKALRLLAGSQHLHDGAGIVRVPAARRRVARVRRAACAALADGHGPLDGGADEELTLVEAVSYARRGRGERRRPTTGWDSLTPVERDVVALVAAGCSNAAIGQRLYISVNTVKKHLSHVYAKVDAGGRADLAAQVARRAPLTPGDQGSTRSGDVLDG